MTKKQLMQITKTKDFIKVIKKLGYSEKPKNGSSHRIFYKKNKPILSIPDGGKKTISTGSKRNIVKLILGNAYYIKKERI